MMFLKQNMSLSPNNLVDVAKSSIWNTLIPSCPKLPDDIVDSDDNENEEDDDDEKCEYYSLCLKMIVHVPKFGEVKVP